MSEGLEALITLKNGYMDNEKVVITRKAFDNQVAIIEKELKALDILSKNIIIEEKNGYVEFYCHFSLPTNSKYEKEEHFKEEIDLLKEALL